MTDPAWGLWSGLALALVGLIAGAIHRSFYGGLGEKLIKGLAVAVTVLGAQIAINNMIYVPTGAWRQVETADDLEKALLAAEERKLPVVIDFGATWCAPCLEMDKLTFHNPEVEPILTGRFELIKIDVTSASDTKLAIQKAFHSKTLPSVLLYPSNTRWSDLLEPLRRGEAMPRPVVQLQQMTHAPEFKQLLATVE
jgi:thiol:disulfide interchange protein DsbD